MATAALTLVALRGNRALAQQQPAREAADLVLRNGKIVTVDEARPLAQALACKGATIIFVGSDDEVAARVGPQTRVLDLGGRLVLPGFIEGHGHLLALGEAMQQVDLSQAESWEEVVQAVERAARQAPRGTWIVGAGWHQGHWKQPPRPAVQGYPVHDRLSAVTPENPVLLRHASGHMCFANALAMQRAGVDDQTRDPRGGQILRDASGRATGAFRETAEELIEAACRRARASRLPAEIEREARDNAQRAMRHCLARGITSFHDAGSSFATIDMYQRLAAEGLLTIRLYVMVRGEPYERLRELLPKYRVIGAANERLTVRAIKCMADGALGSHGAWLFEPYSDLPGSTGLVVEPLEHIRQTALLAVKFNYQLCTHAIGDRANREILDLYQQIFLAHPDQNDLRWRIEHAQHVHPSDQPRFADLKVIASMQANHATSDGPFVEARLGRRRAQVTSYAWRSLLDLGARLVNGTDAPVEKVDPILCFYSAVTRTMKNGQSFFPEQCMTREEALRSYTLDAAFGAFEEQRKGSLTAGKLADVVVLSDDILSIPAERIPMASVVCTIVGGRVAYQRDDEAASHKASPAPK